MTGRFSGVAISSGRGRDVISGGRMTIDLAIAARDGSTRHGWEFPGQKGMDQWQEASVILEPR